MSEEIIAQYWARDIKQLTGKYVGKQINIFDNVRYREVIYYRAMHMYMLQKYLNWSLVRIVTFYQRNGRQITQHATVINAINKFETVYSYYDSNLRKMLFEMTKGFEYKNKDRNTILSLVDFIDCSFYPQIVGYLEALHTRTIRKEDEENYNSYDRKSKNKRSISERRKPTSDKEPTV
jgi:hypothetical protein